MIDAAQIRAARALLDISQSELVKVGLGERYDRKAYRGFPADSRTAETALEDSDGPGKGGCGVHPRGRPQGARRATKTAVASQTKARARKSALSCKMLFVARGRFLALESRDPPAFSGPEKGSLRSPSVANKGGQAETANLGRVLINRHRLNRCKECLLYPQ